MQFSVTSGQGFAPIHSLSLLALNPTQSKRGGGHFASYILAPALQGGQTPYGGTAWTIPSTIQGEDFDNDGEGIAYHDLTTDNEGGEYRTEEGVDVESTNDTTSLYDLGWIQAGEWTEYTVDDVTMTGTYALDLRLRNAESGGAIHVEVDGVNVTGSIAVPNTGDWSSWETVKVTGILLRAGYGQRLEVLGLEQQRSVK